MAFRLLALLYLIPTLALAGGMGEDLVNAPPAFSHSGGMAVPVDFQFVRLELEFDPADRRAEGVAVVEFFAREEGFPFFDMVPAATSAKLNGKAVSMNTLRSPDGEATFRVLTGQVAALSHNVMELRYQMPSSALTFTESGVRIGFFMSDVGASRELLEQYAPSNFEFDRFQMVVDVTVANATAAQKLFTNGSKSELGRGHWEVRFPAYYTPSSFYFHLTNADYTVVEEEYAGLEKTIPITVYSSSSGNAHSAMSRTKSTLAELERDYGPVAHNQMVVYVTPGGGGMEYCGATMTSLWALGHELTHSWFARGVMPANGNAGWMDEAIASWRDNGYPTSSANPSSGPVTLGGFSVWRRTTPRQAYTEGARLIANFDSLFQAAGGFKSVLRELFTEKHNQVITTEYFKGFIERVTGGDVTNLFNRFVYGKSSAKVEDSGEAPLRLISRHPRPYTKEELQAYR